MIDKTLRKATAERHGPMVVIHMTGGPDCLWLNMYLDCEKGQMTCDSDIGFYAYRPRSRWGGESFIAFCIRLLSDEEWLLSDCCVVRSYVKQWQKRFAEICREVIVPELQKLVKSDE